MASPAKKVVKKKKERKNIPNGVAHIQATFNNTMITITDPVGNVVAWSTPAVRGSKAPERAPLLLPRSLLRIVPKKPRSMA